MKSLESLKSLNLDQEILDLHMAIKTKSRNLNLDRDFSIVKTKIFKVSRFSQPLKSPFFCRDRDSRWRHDRDKSRPPGLRIWLIKLYWNIKFKSVADLREITYRIKDHLLLWKEGTRHLHAISLRLWEVFKRFVKTWICFANPWICTISWPQILTPKRFNLCLTKQILDLYHVVDHKSRHKKIHFESWITNPANFEIFNLFSRIQQIFTNPWYCSTKQILKNTDVWILNPYESRFAYSQIWICESEP